MITARCVGEKATLNFGGVVYRSARCLLTISLPVPFVIPHRF
jgi:hypothetical protein